MSDDNWRKLGPDHRREVNHLIEQAQDDLEGVICRLVAEREKARTESNDERDQLWSDLQIISILMDEAEVAKGGEHENYTTHLRCSMLVAQRDYFMNESGLLRKELDTITNLLRRAEEILLPIANDETERQLLEGITAALEGKPDTLTNLLRETVEVLEPLAELAQHAQDFGPVQHEWLEAAATLLAKIKEVVK